MELVTITNDQIIVKLGPLDCYRLARACQAADCDLTGSTIPDRFFGVEAGTLASLHLAALYQALAAAFLAGAYAGEASYHIDWDRHLLSLAALAERYGGSSGQGAGAAALSAPAPPAGE